MLDLRCPPEGQPFRDGVVVGKEATRLQRRRSQAVDGEPLADDDVCLREHGLDVPVADGHTVDEVGAEREV